MYQFARNLARLGRAAVFSPSLAFFWLGGKSWGHSLSGIGDLAGILELGTGNMLHRLCHPPSPTQ